MIHSYKLKNPEAQLKPFFSPLSFELNIFQGLEQLTNIQLSKAQIEKRDCSFESKQFNVLIRKDDDFVKGGNIAQFDFSLSSNTVVFISEEKVMCQRLSLSNAPSSEDMEHGFGLMLIQTPESQPPVQAQFVPFRGKRAFANFRQPGGGFLRG